MTSLFKHLRLLYLDEDEIIDLEIPKEIGCLLHLRLFDMGSMRTKHLPSSLGNLTQLLTLKLDRLLNVDHMPNIVENMHQLRHLYLPTSKFLMGNMKLGQLRNLQTLVNLPLVYVKVEDLVGLPSLRKLKLKVVAEDELEHLVDMFYTSPNTTFDKLQSLSLSVTLWPQGISGIEISKVAATCPHLHKLKFLRPLVLDLPERFLTFHQLNELILINSDFDEDPMPHLGKLPKLRVLRLESTMGKDTIIFFSKNSFPCLQSLVLEREAGLKNWIIEKGALPLLSVLQVADCAKLKALPRGLKFVDSLQELQIRGMPKEFVERITDSDSHMFKNGRLRWNY